MSSPPRWVARGVAPVAGLTMDRPRIMGILNVTPDSFSDGGRFLAPEAAVAQARVMVADGADILDIGGESTRPGAVEVPIDEEIARVVPVIAALRDGGVRVPISVDTRKAAVARAAVLAGADIVNDVSAMLFDPAMAETVADLQCPVVLMHAQGLPDTMQKNPHYEDVVAEVISHLAARIEVARATGIDEARIVVDPGIGFGKTQEHNIALLRNLHRLHDLGCPVMLGASRKRFIGTITGAEAADARMPGSVAVALFGVTQGVQILRVHDTQATKQAVAMQMALMDRVK